MLKKIGEMWKGGEEKKQETKTTVYTFSSKDKKIVEEKNPEKIFQKKPTEKNENLNLNGKSEKIPEKKIQFKDKKHNESNQFNNGGKKPLGKGKKLRIIPIGGFEEVGKNSMIFEYGNDIMVSDMGLQFAEAEMLGVDYVIPDISYLKGKKQNIRGIFITHGHLDHIGALKHVLPELGHPNVYGTKLTMALAKKSCEEAPVPVKSKFIDIDPNDDLQLGIFKITPFRVNHSIPDGVGIRVKTPNGSIVHTGDFKFDFTPADGVSADFGKIAQIGAEGVVASFVDSTNSGKEGYSRSEKTVGESLEKIIQEADGRIIMALFSSLIGRISDIIKFAKKYDKKIFLSGRSLLNNIEIGKQLGYFSEDPNNPIEKLSEKINDYDPKKVILLCTGSQGEDMAALSRISRGEHPIVELTKEDTVVLSSSPIIGNERGVYDTIDRITTFGCNIITNSGMDVHASGHAYQQELLLMHSLLKPKYLVPVHGELHMRTMHKHIIHQKLGFPNENMPILYNGSILEIDQDGNAAISDIKLNYEIVMVDGLGVGDVGKTVIDERHMMAKNGSLFLTFLVDQKTKKLKQKPMIDTRGFITIKDSKPLLAELTQITERLYNDAVTTNPNIELRLLKKVIANGLVRFTDRKIKRVPLISSNVIYL